jgi:hypothetical protein
MAQQPASIHFLADSLDKSACIHNSDSKARMLDECIGGNALTERLLA